MLGIVGGGTTQWVVRAVVARCWVQLGAVQHGG